MIFWRKIVIFHTKYPKNFRASLRSAQFFLVRPPNLKSWIRPCKDTKVVIKIRKSKKDRQHNGQKKKDKGKDNDLQNTT
jgi:hypothetical protein